jgi:hypothetical protein
VNSAAITLYPLLTEKFGYDLRRNIVPIFVTSESPFRRFAWNDLKMNPKPKGQCLPNASAK